MRRRSLYIPGFSHENPIPAACVVGSTMMTGAVHGGGKGSDPTEFSDDPLEQCELMFDRLATILAEAESSWDDVIKLSVRIQNSAVRQSLNQRWLEIFPNEYDRPVRQVAVGTTRDHILIQSEMTAILPCNDQSCEP